MGFSSIRRLYPLSSRLMSKCPVTLHGVDLRAKHLTIHPIVRDPERVSYDPQFVRADGGELLYMTNAGDRSPECQKHVNDCSYAIRRIPFQGGQSKGVLNPGVLARQASDGTLFLRRRGRRGGHRDWRQQSLVMVEAGKPPVVLLKDAVRNRIHHVSPDARWVLLQTQREGRTLLEIIGRDGKRARPGLGGAVVRTMGWSARPLPAGPARVRPPPKELQLREAVNRATQHVGPRGETGFLGVDRVVYQRLGSPGRRFLGEAPANRWLAESPRRALVVSRGQYCALRRRVRPGAALRVLDTVDNELVVVVWTQGDDRSKPAPKARMRLATFDARSAGGGHVELMGYEVPTSVRPGGRFRAVLHWRVLQPFPRHWKVFVHIDGQASRVLADHAADLCGAASWKAGELIRDRFDVTATTAYGAPPPGRYQMYVGWFAGNRRARVTASTPTKGNRYRVAELRLSATGP